MLTLMSPPQGVVVSKINRICVSFLAASLFVVPPIGMMIAEKVIS